MKRSSLLRSAAGAVAFAALLGGAACSEGASGQERPAPTTSTTWVVDPDAQQGVTPGAFCSPEGAKGQTVTGKAMNCSKGGESRARWRSS